LAVAATAALATVEMARTGRAAVVTLNTTQTYTVPSSGNQAPGALANNAGSGFVSTWNYSNNTTAVWSDGANDVPGTNATYTNSSGGSTNASSNDYVVAGTASSLVNLNSPYLTNATQTTTFYGHSLNLSYATLSLNNVYTGSSPVYTYNFSSGAGLNLSNSGITFSDYYATIPKILTGPLALAGSDAILTSQGQYTENTSIGSVVSGTGTLTFNASGSAGTTPVVHYYITGVGSTYAGTVVLGTANAGSTFALNRSLGSVATFNVSTSNWTLQDNITNGVNGAAVIANGGVTISGATASDTFGPVTGAGAITASGTTALTLNGVAAGSTYSGVLSGANLSVVKATAGTTQTLTGANTYGGGTLVSAGRLGVGSSAAMGTGVVNISSGATVYISAGTIANNFILNGPQSFDTYGALRVDGGASVTGNILLAGNTQIGSYSGNGTISGVISDGGNGYGFAKTGGSGNGTITLTAANTYSGPTSVTAGTLSVANTTGSATGTGDVTLNGGSFTSGTVGTITGNLIAGSGAHGILPGGAGAIGTLNVGGLTTSSLTTLTFDLGNGSSGVVTNGDLLNVGAGTVSIGAGTVLSFNTSSAVSGLDYRLFGGAGVAGLTTGNFVLPAAPNGVYTLSSTVDPGYLDLVVSARSLTWNNAGGTGDGKTWDTTDANFNDGTGPVTFVNTALDNVTFNDANNGNDAVAIPAVVTPGSTTVATNQTYTFSGAGGIGGAGPLTVSSPSGTGTLVLATSNSFTGPTSLLSGTLDLQNGSALAGSTLASPAGTVVFDAAVTANAFTFGGLSGSGALALQNSTGTAVTLSVGANNASTTYAGSLAGPGALTKVGTGTLTLTGGNAYAGVTTLSGGTLAIGSATALPATPVRFAAASTLNLGGNSPTVPQVNVSSGVTGTLANGTLALAPGGSLLFAASAASTSNLTGGTIAISGGATLDASAANATNVTGIVETVASQITGTGGLTVKGFGSTADNGGGNSSLLNLTNTANNFTGGVTIASGFLNVSPGGDAVLGNGTNPATNVVTIDAGAGLLASANASSTTPLTLNTASIVLVGAGDHFIRRYGSTNLIINGVISDDGSGAGLRFTDGALGLPTVLAGANTYTGPTTINDNALVVTGNESAATGGYTIGSGSAYATTVAFNAGSSIVVASGKAINIGTLPGSTAVSSANQTLNASSGVNNAGTLAVGRAGYLNVNSGATWNQSGPMSIQPVNASGYSAYVTVNAGGAFNYSGSTPINLSPSVGNGGYAYLAIAGGTFTTDQAFNNASPAGTPPTVPAASNGSSSIVLTAGGTIALSGNVPVLTTTAGEASIFAVGNGSGGVINTNGFNTALTTPITNASSLGVLTKTGAGTLALTGISTYTGGTTIAAGTLVANGSSASLGTGPVSVTGGVLAGTGATGAGTVTLTANGTVTAGSGATASDTIGTLTLGAFNAAGGTYAVKLDGSKASAAGTLGDGSSDVLTVTGLTTVGTATPALTITPVAITSGAGSFTVGSTYSFVVASSTANAFNSLVNAITVTPGPSSPSGTYGVTEDAGGDELILTYTDAAPEPTSLLLAGLAAAPLALGRRRRSQSMQRC
jgi:autotransporter-associated beta strand protein